MSKTLTRSTDVALVVVPVAEKNRALAFSFDGFGFEQRTDPAGKALFADERN